MTCPRCHTENPAGMRFCGQCAAPLARTCPSCGAANPPENRFCGHCATALDPATTRVPAPETYTPKHLAERIVTSKGALEGERKQVTVLFADLKGSMELLADRDPEDARKILDPVLELMMEAVHRYEGTVNQVMGDGVMALFGAPLAHEDHAPRACYAAVRMQEAVKRYSESLRRSHGLEVQIRVGLNSGEVVVRSIGSDLRMDYTAVGQTTHLAARMEQLATPGTIRLTAGTLRLAEGYVAVTPLGPVPVKGLAEPVEVYEVNGVGAVRSRLQAAAARGLTRFVGRHAELDRLHQALAQAAAGHGQLVAAVGEPGVGKSRLFYEFAHSHRTEGWLVLASGSVSYGKATSYLPVIELLKAYFKVHDRETNRDIREKVTGKVLTLDRALEPLLPALLALLDVPVEDAQWAGLDPPRRRRKMIDAVKRLLIRESQVQPLLVILEDLHWIDGETAALVDALVDGLPAARFLLLVNYRPEYQHTWGSKTYYAQLRLDALPPANADELLLTLLGTDPTVEPLKPVLVTRTGGNPLFLEESVRALVETGALVGARGQHRLARSLDTIDVPVTVQAILASRIDRLDPADKLLLQTAAVVGKDVPLPLLLAVADLPEDDVRRALGHLQAAEFLYEAALFPDLEYTFKHALTHEVAYAGLLHQRRRQLHARIVDVIERQYADRLGEQTERLANHAVRAEAWDKAVRYLWQAGRNARDRSAYRQAIAFLEQALEVARRLPDTVETAGLRIDVLCRDLVDPLNTLTEYRRGLVHLREAELLAERVGDRARLAEVLARSVFPLRFSGQHALAEETGERALALAQDVGNAQLTIHAQLELALAHTMWGDARRAEALVRETLVALDGLPETSRNSHTAWLRRRALMTLVRALTAQGRFPEAVQRGEEALGMAEELGHPAPLAGALYRLGFAHCAWGDVDTAIALCARSVAISREWEVNDSLQWSLSYLGAARVLADRLPDAIADLEAAVAAAESSGSLDAFTLVVLGDAYRRVGRVPDAITCAARALDMSRQHRQRGNEAEVRHLLGTIAAVGDGSSRAEASTHYREALVIADELGMRPLAAHCHAGLAALYDRGNRPAEARKHRTTAATMYGEMGMTYWLEKTPVSESAG